MQIYEKQFELITSVIYDSGLPGFIVFELVWLKLEPKSLVTLNIVDWKDIYPEETGFI